MKKVWNLTHYKNNKNVSFLDNELSQYISKGEKIMIAVSGGADSMFLSYLVYDFFVRNNYSIQNILFIHLNHNIRKESVQESEKIQQRFKGLSIKIVTRTIDGKKTENELRKWRYATFLEYMKENNVDKILLGHHFDDRVETSLLNLVRGCGIDGFMGIKTVESHHLLEGKKVIRPLISLRKSKILTLCNQYKIPYVSDITNQDISVSQRNYVRHEIIPNVFSQKGCENLFKNRYKKYDTTIIKDLLQPITIHPERKVKSAYCLSKERKDIEKQDILRILKQLHASSGITSETIQELYIFVTQKDKGWKYIQGVIIMIAHNKVYFFVGKPLFREKTLDNKKQIITLHYKGKTWNKYCIAQKIPLFRRNFIPVITRGNKIISRDKSQRKTTTIY